MTVLTAHDYHAVIAARIGAERLTIAGRWLARLRELLTVGVNDVFPSEELLDHIPALVEEIAGYVAAPAEGEIAANAAVIEKARELGQLRHRQRATAHQLLHEYEILGEILETFLVEETERLALRPTIAECFEAQRRLTRSVRVLMRTTVDTFVGEYTATIQEQTDRIKAFHRSASHELRSPIGTLLFAGALLETDVVRGDQARLTKVAATVRSNAERLSWIVENLQRMARITEPVDGPSEQLVDLRSLVDEVARQLDAMAVARAVEIRIAPTLPTLHVDPARLELVLLNLLSNAIKYSDPHKTASFVEVMAAPDAEGAEVCTICVRDNGIGIQEADRAAVFERFFRAHAHLDQELGVTGTGLGLAIVTDCIEALGATILCESVFGEGTTFSIVLPVTTADRQS